MKKFKIKTGDNVVVITGKDKGKKGKVTKIITKDNKAVVAGVNLVYKHTKPSQTSEGGILQKELPIHISNIAHIDPQNGKPTKISYKKLSDGSKVRVAKKSGEIIQEIGK